LLPSASKDQSLHWPFQKTIRIKAGEQDQQLANRNLRLQKIVNVIGDNFKLSKPDRMKSQSCWPYAQVIHNCLAANPPSCARAVVAQASRL
jgi:hypothetical protein